jgi:ubiquinone/menaquinone biosynthesis C-methylase UbiE
VRSFQTLSPDEAAAVYDRLGQAQDTQAFYEDPAVDVLIAHSNLGAARSIFEVGCGTGRVAQRVLRHQAPEAHYRGVDVSATMVRLARDRLATFGSRATVVRTDGAFSFAVPTASQDRVLATYVLDLLAPEAIQACLAEARRILRPAGRLCVAGLTWGERPMGRLVSTLWAALHRVRPRWVGGCRPLCLRRVLDPYRWALHHAETVQAWGVPSEVLVASPTSA